MAVVRSNPVPPGVYWVDLFRPSDSQPDRPDQLATFDAWRRANADRVKVITTEEFEEPMGGGPLRTFVILRVAATPTDYPFRELGFLNPAHADVQSSDDTVSKPEPPSPGDIFAGIASSGAGLGLLLLGLYLWSQRK